MTRIIFTLLSAATLFGIQTAHSADRDGKYSIRGAGLLSCATFVTERTKKSPAYMMIGGWLDGYITASNKLQPDTYDVTPYVTTELLSVLINRHCKDNPDDTLAPVASGLLASLRDDRLKISSPLVEVTIGKYQTRLYVDTIRKIQASLAGKADFTGAKNGLWSDETGSALARYRKSIGFEATGFPDQKTLWYLFRSKE